MKKIIYLFILLFILIFPIKVNANEAKCVYQNDNLKIKLTLYYKMYGEERDTSLKYILGQVNGETVYYINDETNISNETDRLTISLNSTSGMNNIGLSSNSNEKKRAFRVSDFVDLGTGKLLCKNSVYVAEDKSYNDPSKTYYTFSFKNEYTYNAKLKKDESSVTNNSDESNDFIHKDVTCESFKETVSPIWLTIRILSPIVVLILGAVDFMKMTTSESERNMRKPLNTFIKRLIILAVIFILPTIVDLIVGFTAYGDLTSCL